jgi:IclR family acetate operon transcriptional repressor
MSQRPTIPEGGGIQVSRTATSLQNRRRPMAGKGLSHQVHEDLLVRIGAREFRPGDKLPGEVELMNEYGVGRNTIREAIRGLVALRVVDVRPRRGATVLAVSPDLSLPVDVASALVSEKMTDDLYEMRVLEAAAAAGGPHGLADITLRAGILKSTAHRLAVLLAAEGYLVSVGGGRYGVGPQLRTLAAEVMRDANDGVHSLLQDLQQAVGGHTVHLALRSGDHAVYIQKVDSSQPYQLASRVGMRIPLHCTAIGKVILSQLPAATTDEIIARAGLPRRTATTITRRADLHRELQLIRGRGYALDNEENEPTIRCIAVPVADAGRQLLGGVSISAVTFVTTAEELETFAAPLMAAASSIAQVLC